MNHVACWRVVLVLWSPSHIRQEMMIWQYNTRHWDSLPLGIMWFSCDYFLKLVATLSIINFIPHDHQLCMHTDKLLNARCWVRAFWHENGKCADSTSAFRAATWSQCAAYIVRQKKPFLLLNISQIHEQSFGSYSSCDIIDALICACPKYPPSTTTTTTAQAKGYHSKTNTSR